jgi:hypothetical protein
MMAIGPLINQDNLLEQLRSALTKEMQAAAEPLVKEATDRIVNAMRQRVAEMVVAMIRTEVDIFKDGRNLLVRIQDRHPGDARD